jgi:zinc protease
VRLAMSNGVRPGFGRIPGLLVALVAALGWVALAGAANAATPDKPGVFHPTTFTLKNGLRVVVVVNRRAPVALHMVWYKAGAADETPGKSGVAHFLEHLMFKGTERFGPGEFSKIVAANGGRENAFTSWDYTAFYQFIAKDRLATVMKLEADRMANLVLTAGEVRNERSVILEERRTRVDNRPSSILWEQVRRALYLNSPYGRPVIGWMHEMKTLSLQDEMSFYRRFYGPNNAVVVVAGDVDPAHVKALAERYYGPVKPIKVTPRVRPHEGRQLAARRVIYRDPRVVRPSFVRMYLAPSYSRGARRYAYALQVLDQILGSSTTSRLYQALVVNQKLATSVGSGYSASALYRSNFYIYASPRQGVPLAKLEAAIDAEIARLVKDGVTAKEVAGAKQRLKDAAIFARDNLRTGAMAFGTALTTGRKVADVEAWPTRVGKVTVAEVNAAARYVLRIQRSVTGLLRPKAAPTIKKAEK